MAISVKLPALGESVNQAVLVKWHAADGDKIASDQPICALETDKANVDLPAPGAGYLRRRKQVGDTVRVGEELASLEDSMPAGAAPRAAAPEPVAAVAAGGGGGGPSHAPQELAPSVRRLVTEKGLDPAAIAATGRGGRLTKEDVLAHQARPPVAAAPDPVAPVPPEPAAPAPAPGGVRKVPISKLRRKIAERLVSAQNEAAMLTTFNEVDMTAVVGLRKTYKEKFEKTHGVGLGFMSFFVRASQLALAEIPEVNAYFGADEIEYHDYCNIGIAVSTERGLIVPVLKRVETLTMAEIEKRIKRMAGAARDGKLAIDDLSGGTFTITNGGVFGSLMSTPILNKPQTGILGMHAIKDRPVAIEGKVEIRPMMYLALSYDHRLIDGAQSVTFLVKVKERLEDPARLLLEI